MAGDPVREEAERLVAAAIAAFSMAARGVGATGGRGSFATGSPECCVCPVCRVIAAMREPDGDIVERLATGAGDLATGITGLLRSLSRPGPGRQGREEPQPSSEGDDFWESLRLRARGAASWESEEDNPWRTATTAPPAQPPKPMAKKAVAKKAVANNAVAKKAVAKKAVAKKAVAKKVAKKAQPRKATGSGGTRD